MKIPLIPACLVVLAAGGASIGGTYLGTKEDWEYTALKRGRQMKTSFENVESTIEPRHQIFKDLLQKNDTKWNPKDKNTLEKECNKLKTKNAKTIFTALDENLKEDFIEYCCELIPSLSSSGQAARGEEGA